MLDNLLTSVKYLVIFYVSYYIIIPLLKIIYTHFIAANFFSGRKDLRNYGEWAVVTGATDGIGQAYARELAKDGFNVLLISRTESKLKDEADYIEKTYKVKTKISAVDFTKTDIYGNIKDALANLDVGVLVNNVGMSYPHPAYVHDEENLPDDIVMGMINCNTTSAVMMIRSVVPGMVFRGKGGAIINISSFSGDFPVPFLTIYSATKAFLDFLSRAVGAEISERHNIEVQSVLPLFVATKMSRMKPSFTSPSPKAYVQSALSLVGIESRTCGCLSHALQAHVMSLIPGSIRISYLGKMLHGWMVKALARKQKSQ